MSNSRKVIGVTGGCAVAIVLLSGCGGSSTPAAGSSTPSSSAPFPAENRPPGDIPDDQAFVDYTAPDGSFTVKVPEGWAQTKSGSDVVFSSKFNSITLTERSGFYQPTEQYAKTVEVPKIASTTTGFTAGKVQTVQRRSGPVLLITYRADSPPSPVTGKSVPLDVERYEFAKSGRGVVITLSAPSGSDNVDAWRTVTDSLTWKP